MNERIRELVTLASEYADHYDKIGVDHSFQNIFNEKFAELIVRECCKIMVEHSHRRAGVVKRNVKLHFGVEE